MFIKVSTPFIFIMQSNSFGCAFPFYSILAAATFICSAPGTNPTNAKTYCMYHLGGQPILSLYIAAFRELCSRRQW